MVPPPLLAWAAQLELSGLPDYDAEAAGSLLRRFHQLEPGARDALAAQLATAIAARVSPPPPPGTPALAYLAAVLAVRRERDLARATGGWAGQQPWTVAPASPAHSAPEPARRARAGQRPAAGGPRPELAPAHLSPGRPAPVSSRTECRSRR